jgi:hypothetical protein
VVDLGVGDSLLVKQLAVPEGVTLLVDPNDKVATCRVPTAVEEPEAVEGEEVAASSAEPEVIGRPKEETEEE